MPIAVIGGIVKLYVECPTIFCNLPNVSFYSIPRDAIASKEIYKIISHSLKIMPQRLKDTNMFETLVGNIKFLHFDER